MIAKKSACVVVADAGGAEIYRIATRVSGVKLDDLESMEGASGARTSELGRDRPPRAQHVSGHSSAFAEKDLHQAEEDAFATRVAERIERLVAEAPRGVILFAPPRFLGALRSRLSDAARRGITAEIARDMRGLKVCDLEKAVGALD
jgi:protein required for attachment to host cells